jgi:aryl-alcohol dehydrogenase-like predicted oxidoreductase
MLVLMKIQRREFVKRSALGLGGILAGVPLVKAAEAKPACFDPYQIVPLGRTRIQMSRLCQGTGMSGAMRQSNHTRMGKEKLEALLHGGYERGIRTYDLADLYGTHRYLLPALKEIPRDKISIITKVWPHPGSLPEKERPAVDVTVTRFLKEIGTDYLDLVLLHCASSPKWTEEWRPQMDGLEKLKEKGLIRAHGVSCHSVAALEAAAADPWVDSVHARINPYGIKMDDTPEKVVPVLRKIHAAGKGVIGMKIIGEGRLRNEPEKRDMSAKFVLGLGCVDILNVGFEKIEEIDDFAGRVSQVPRPI